ncbi:MAG: hypothetical protein A3H32_14360 [Betaproteobacteria bacterium RIFCSPLOWO2_02_FULL_63_19]|nr:MAG: hypothetical protein A3H32_14360 [Betaproteobacteria bacterium RIFCSPLOWO2_02_FULL_63_19]
MPARPLRPCAAPGCGALVVTGRCALHRVADRRAQDVVRGSTTERGYDWAWRKLRARYLDANPLCECDECKAGKLKVTVAQVVDHRIAIEDRPDLRLEWSNLRSMSKAHHDAHTARTRGWGRAHRA